LVKKLIESGKSVEEQVKLFSRLANKSRATYYRLKKKLEISQKFLSQNLIPNEIYASNNKL
jgi:hypothetical protein